MNSDYCFLSGTRSSGYNRYIMKSSSLCSVVVQKINKLLAIFKKEARSKAENTIMPLINPWFTCILTAVAR